MVKIIRLGKGADGNIFCKIEYTDGKLSISGVEGPTRDGNARGGCGQIEMHLVASAISPAPGWTRADIQQFLDYWRAWHLNNLRAGCEHQRAAWNPAEKLQLEQYTWADRYHAARRAVESGTATPAEYEEYMKLTPRVHAVTIEIKRVNYRTPEVAELLAAGWIKVQKTEEKTAGWVYPESHPGGLLGKPCDVCGYKYGSAWLREEVPADVIEWLFSRPATDIQPAWV